ncbi:GFA family protein [Teredinibacter purpureus]|uniref:GFA family protein n=1 Tax=Teredinibacter purpureus TaxID=2731756 RepID=UPI0005F7C97C|nr:GFA family protein [Teredinibacter purpureus]
MYYPIKGACQCGQITYVLHQAPTTVLACHCTECQKLSTSPFSVTALVSANAIEFYGPLQEWRRVADSGKRNYAKFCGTCGNRIYHYSPDDLGVIKLKLKPISSEYAAIFSPTMHIWVSSKLSWYEIPEGMKTVDKQPVLDTLVR